MRQAPARTFPARREAITVPTFFLAVYAAVTLVMQQNHIPMLSVGIIRGGTPAYAAGYGGARASSVYRVASLSKAFTALAVDRAIATGRLRMTTRVAAFYPPYPRAANVTIAQLLNHTSGIPSYSDVISLDPYAHQTPEALIGAVAGLPLVDSPGTAFYYSNTNYALLGLALERAYARPYAAVVRRLVIEPLHLRASAYGDQPDELPGYRFQGGRTVPARRSTVSYAYAAAGISSNVPDLLRIAGAAAPQYDGWLQGRMQGHAVRFLTGNVDGYSAIAVVEPSSRDAIVVLCNEDRIDLVPLAEDLLDAVAPAARNYAP